MATAPPSQDPRTVVRTSTALWSEIVRGVRGTDDVLTPHDPAHFERVLRQRVRHAQTLSSSLLDAPCPAH